MTKRLTQHFPAFQVNLLYSGLQCHHTDEAATLQLPLQRLAYTREVLLYSQHAALIYAHSVTHPCWLKRYFSHLYQQGNTPLGNTLFANKRIQRSAFEITRIRAHHHLYRKIQKILPFPEPYLWARRSCFIDGPAKLMVTEVFLPPLIDWLKAT